MTRNVGIYVYEDCEVLDYAGPYEVFSTASRVHRRLHPDEPIPFVPFLVAAEAGEVATRGGLRVVTEHSFAHHPAIDVLIIPGGPVERELKREALFHWTREVYKSAEIVASVCTGVFFLAKAGLVDGLAVTTHWEDVGDFCRMFPGVTMKENARWVDEGRVITSAGISAGIDMSLYIVSRLAGEGLAAKTTRQMDYRWQSS